MRRTKFTFEPIARAVERRDDEDFTMRLMARLREDAALSRFLRGYSLSNVAGFLNYADTGETERAIRRAVNRVARRAKR